MHFTTLQKSLLLIIGSSSIAVTALAQEYTKQPAAIADSTTLRKARAEAMMTRQIELAQHKKKPFNPITAARADNSCNLAVNGDFEIQLAAPTNTGNIATPISDTRNELSSWFAPNFTSPDYFADNGVSFMTPGASIRGAFTPLNGPNPNTVDGTVGIVYSTQLGGSAGYPEYVAQRLPTPLAQAVYYAEFWTLNASLYRHSNTLGLYLAQDNSADPPDPSRSRTTDYTTTPNLLPMTSGRGFSSGPLTNNGQWVRVSGLINANAGDNFLTIGYPNPGANSGVNAFAQGNIWASYYYIDDVALYRVPTAGPDVTGCVSAAQLGTGCAIPGATYAWTASSNPSVVFATSLIVNVAPTAPTTYTMRVTLPDGSVHASSANVSSSFPPAVTNLTGYADPYLNRVRAGVSPFVAGATYRWYLNGKLWPSLTASTVDFRFDVLECEYYLVTVEVLGACGNFSAPYSESFGNDCGKPAKIESYPNPANASVILTSPAARVEIINDKGTTVFRQENTQQIDVRQLPEGLYQLRIMADGKATTQRLQIKH